MPEETPIEPLEVFAVSDKLLRATGSIPYTSLTWERKYYESGQFSMTVPASVYKSNWAMIVAPKRHETGLIQKVQYTDDPTYGNEDTVTVSGFFLESILNRKTFLDETPEEVEYRYYVAPPKAPVDTFKDPELYEDDSGNYYYETPSGNFYRVPGGSGFNDGSQVLAAGKPQTDSDGNTYFNTGSGNVTVTKVDAPTKPNRYYYKDQEVANTINECYSEPGSNPYIHEFQVEFSDGFGNVYYDDGTGLKRAYGMVDRIDNGVYCFEKRNWEQNTDEGWVTVTIEVAGPWARTDFEDYNTPQDNVQLAMKWVKMFFENNLIYEDTDITGETKICQPVFDLLGDWVYAELQTVGAAPRIEYSFEINQFVFSIWQGKDRTQAANSPENGTVGGNPFYVFSDTWGTLYGYEAIRDDSNYRNTCFVLQDYDRPTQWDGDRPYLEPIYSEDGVTLLGWEIPYTTMQGWLTVRLEDDYDDREISLDLRGQKPEGDDTWSREMYKYDANAENTGRPSLPAIKENYDNFPDNLKSQGETLLKTDYPIVETLETQDLRRSSYLRDYDLGDKVDMLVSTLGLVQEARIVGITETYEAGFSQIDVEIGEQKLTTLKKARLQV